MRACTGTDSEVRTIVLIGNLSLPFSVHLPLPAGSTVDGAAPAAYVGSFKCTGPFPPSHALCRVYAILVSFLEYKCKLGCAVQVARLYMPGPWRLSLQTCLVGAKSGPNATKQCKAANWVFDSKKC
jgi:hypothetical protein